MVAVGLDWTIKKLHGLFLPKDIARKFGIGIGGVSDKIQRQNFAEKSLKISEKSSCDEFEDRL